MPRVLDPFRFLLITVAGWMNHRHLCAIDYLREENRVLREQLGQRRLRLSDDQRRRLDERSLESIPIRTFLWQNGLCHSSPHDSH